MHALSAYWCSAGFAWPSVAQILLYLLGSRAMLAMSKTTRREGKALAGVELPGRLVQYRELQVYYPTSAINGSASSAPSQAHRLPTEVVGCWGHGTEQC